ncbi:RNI-like protein [Basidiobolus meristosporus CBS 931.73]|uniref:RNI-like protein n=1 Tax=Basidiobolus meristosporus CBS 931.73 TaxID=1314790 RepID=A0A1Y1YXA7_9FUNG|nr:RNI-like protein [Basidiobolus meristosporus CBS 931.73]|eukprot:ORY02619.1 RNI-like protein [Basidiobolus meristosporus CBS 931.73]
MAEQSEDQTPGVDETNSSHPQPPPLVKRDTFGHSMQHPSDILAQLISMGFSPPMAETAIFESGGGNLDRALAWLLDSHEPVPEEEPEVKDAPSEDEDTSDLYVETDDDIRIQKKVPPPSTTKPHKSILKTTSAYQGLSNHSSKSRIREWIFGGPKAATYTNTKVNASNFMRNTLLKYKGNAHHNEPSVLLDDEDEDISAPVEKEVKKVRFCTDLHLEVPPSPIEWSATPDTVSEESEVIKDVEEQKPRTEEKYTPGQVLEHYEATCRTREVPVIGQLVSTFKRAEQRKHTLTHIELQSAPFTRESMLTFTDSLDLPFGLTKLTLENCGLDDDLLKTLIHSLIFTCQISELSLARNRKIKHGGLRYIGLFIKKSQHLKHLDLSGIPLDKKSARQIGPYFASRQKNGLQSLKLDECGLKSNILEFIVPSLRRSSIRSLSLRKNQINHVGALWIGVLLRDYEDDVAPDIMYSRARPCPPPVFGWKVGLERLDVSMNEIKGGIQYVAQSLKRNLMLRELILTQNGIDTRGMTQLADSLALNKNLKLFDLSRNPCGMSTDGIIAVRSALASNDTLETLVLSETRINSEGAIALAEFLPETKCLKNLDLSSNPEIDIAGVLALSVSLRMNWSIVCLDVSVAPDDPELAELSRDILSTCIRNMEKMTQQAPARKLTANSGNSVDCTDTIAEDASGRGQAEVAKEVEETEAHAQDKRSIKFSEPSIAPHSRNEGADSTQTHSSDNDESHPTLREKYRAMINNEASALLDNHIDGQANSAVPIIEDPHSAASPEDEQQSHPDFLVDPAIQQQTHSHLLLHNQGSPHTLNEEQIVPNVEENAELSHLPDSQIKEKEKQMEHEEAQALRNQAKSETIKEINITYTNGHTVLVNRQ